MKNIFILFIIVNCIVSAAQSGTEIFLFDLEMNKGQIFLSNGINITKHKGYDNQPFFHPDQPLIYYSSFDDSGRSDIKIYNYSAGTTANLTVTPEREYSPTVTPDGKFISCILQRDNGAQDLVLYPINGGAPEVLINTLKVGYHAWAEENELLLFVLDDSIHNSLHYYRLDSKKDRVLAKNPGRSLQKIPGENAMSFVQKNQGRISIISKIELPVLSITPVTETLPGQEYMVWLNKYVLLMSDGDKIFSKAPPIDKEWQPLSFTGDVPVIKGITRLAANSTYTKLAVVVSE